MYYCTIVLLVFPTRKQKQAGFFYNHIEDSLTLHIFYNCNTNEI
ncbi:hypothetical protein B4084_3591 [Bacillus cereus]|nr:hypothetical protein B4084_3591 [Bacillus cereus]